uniref:Uncharacterized protein n=1 Tax=Anguilla anguilla TaxID=7936 RepID=A0A0E9XFY3_ANGAN
MPWCALMCKNGCSRLSFKILVTCVS